MSAATTIPAAREWFLALKTRLSPAATLRELEPLSRHTTLRVGGPADAYAEPATEEDLRQILAFCAELRIPWMMLGRGSNLLVRDGGIRGVVITLGDKFHVIDRQENALRCGAAARLRTVAFEAKNASLSGFEFMEGIPGNVGGALRMNAGAMGSSIFELVESVRVMDASGEVSDRAASSIPVEYRNCALFRTHIALSTLLRGHPDDRANIDRRMNECSQKRWKSQPQAPSAGCIFKNCITVPTGKLVQELGLKGARAGGAMVSDVHGNFIVNTGGATARDVLELIDLVKETAWRLRGIELHTEVQIVGED